MCKGDSCVRKCTAASNDSNCHVCKPCSISMSPKSAARRAAIVSGSPHWSGEYPDAGGGPRTSMIGVKNGLTGSCTQDEKPTAPPDFSKATDLGDQAHRLDEDDPHVRDRRVEGLPWQAGVGCIGGDPGDGSARGLCLVRADGDQLRRDVHGGHPRAPGGRSESGIARSAGEVDQHGVAHRQALLDRVDHLGGDGRDAFGDSLVATGGPDRRR